MKRIIVGIGEILWDLLPGGKRLGGAPANFAFHSHALGAEGVVVSCVGNDGPGREIISTLNKRSLESTYVFVDGSFPTGTVSVDPVVPGGPDYTIRENAAWDHIPRSPLLERLAAHVDAVCFGTLAQRSPASRETIRFFLGRVPERALKILDMNLRRPFYNREIVESSLQIANVVKLNESELGVVTDVFCLSGERPDLMAELSRRFDLELVALTLGARGSLLYRGGELSTHAGFEVEVVDTVGAGDAFAAALTVGKLAGDGLDVLNSAANRAAARVCSIAGAFPGD